MNRKPTTSAAKWFKPFFQGGISTEAAKGLAVVLEAISSILDGSVPE
jgi:hypothetical protein